ncbi:hypothetical protein BG015_005793, partial [Linnemannia schmuckeri]
ESYWQEHYCQPFHPVSLAVPSPSTVNTEGKGKGKGTKVLVSNAKEALARAAQTTEDHLYSKKTKTNYKGQVTRALAYAAAQTEPGWRNAFTKIPSLTPTVLMAYVASKCQGHKGEGLSYKTTEGIKSGLKHYFKTELGCLTDSWSCDSDGDCTGNPYMRRPLSDTFSLSRIVTDEPELTRLQMKDIELGLTTDTGSPFFTITLTFRKTNQADASKANVYQIHPQPDYEAICCYTKLKAWLQWVKGVDGGFVKFQEALSQIRVQDWLDRLTNQTGILARRNGRFTMHCFRRGGAQFRFMFAKEKWSLKAVKWWGGWSEGEGTGTIMWYLLEEFTRH